MRALRCHLACLWWMLAPAAALARGPAPPRYAGSCPEGYFRGFLDGTKEYVSNRRICSAIPVDRLGRAQADRTTCWESPTPPAQRPSPTTRIHAQVDLDRSASSWTLLHLRVGGRRLLTWRSYYPLFCTASVYLSEDRRLIAVEILRSSDYLPTGEPHSEVVSFHLPRPLS